MGIIHDAQTFVQSLLAPLKRRRCPHCGSPLLKKNGTYTRTLRDLGGIRTIRVQRCRCCACGHTFSEQRPEIAPHRWYTRRVQRKYLDLYVTIGGSLRCCADWLTAEITGRGRAFLWDVLARAPWWGRAPEPEPEMALSHTTGWRWLKAAGEHWSKARRPMPKSPKGCSGH